MVIDVCSFVLQLITSYYVSLSLIGLIKLHLQNTMNWLMLGILYATVTNHANIWKSITNDAG